MRKRGRNREQGRNNAVLPISRRVTGSDVRRKGSERGEKYRWNKHKGGGGKK